MDLDASHHREWSPTGWFCISNDSSSEVDICVYGDVTGTVVYDRVLSIGDRDREVAAGQVLRENRVRCQNDVKTRSGFDDPIFER